MNVKKARKLLLDCVTVINSMPPTSASLHLRDSIREALAEAGEEDSLSMLKLQKVEDYRFGELIKGQHYAFAKGLTVIPQHLPAALDAMFVDNFKLRGVFGETNCKEIGFIFERTSPDPRITEFQTSLNREVERRRAAEALMRKFVSRVEAGEVRSKVTYSNFKAHLDKYCG